MRVCLLVPVLDAFKGANHLPLLAAMPDMEFTLLCNRMKPVISDFPKNVRCETLNARLGPYYYGCSDFLFARAVIKEYPPSSSFWKQFDVIHINQAMGPALLQLRSTGVPILFLIHHPASADRAVAVEESSFLQGLRWRLRYALLCRWQRRFCHALPNVVTVSHTSADRIASDYGCDRAKIHVMPNGIDGAVFQPGDLASSDADVIAVGSFLHPRKGFPYLAEAYREFSRHGLRIADVGKRSEAQRNILSSIPGVRIFGTVGQQQLHTLIARSSTLISTSLYEGFGLSLIEALACGRPAFAFNGGAVGEVLGAVDSGLVVPLRDTKELVRRVSAFIRLPVLERRRKGEGYRETVLRLYPLRTSAEALREVYGRLAA